MFFKRKAQPKPDDIASQLFDCLQKAAIESSKYQQAIRPKDLEARRFLLSMLLFPIAASHGLTGATQEKSPLLQLFSDAHDVYLARARDQDSLVSLGDYVIWRIERENVTRTLREDFGQVLLTASSFDAHQIRWGMLLRMLADVRKRAYIADMRYALNVAPQNDPKTWHQCLFASCATSFTRYVLQIDPSDPSNSQATMDRFHASVGLGAVMLGTVYFHLIDLTKSARA